MERSTDMNRWLYVEGNRGDAELVRTLTREYCPDVQVVVASDGEEALALLYSDTLQLHAPDATLVLVSSHVPRMECVDLVEQIRQAIGVATVLIVFADLGDERTVASCYEAGASGVVPKPFDLDDWIVTLKHFAGLWSGVGPFSPERKTLC